MLKWFRRQDKLTRAMVLLCAVLTVAVAVRWRQIGERIWRSYGYPFRSAPQEQVVATPTENEAIEISVQDDGNSDN